jgi:hypothetical protein
LSGALAPYHRLGLAAVAVTALAAAPAGFRSAGYAPGRVATSLDTLRPKAIKIAPRTSLSRFDRGAVIPGYLSLRGLPPVRGQFTVTDSGLVFHSAEGVTTWPSTVSLAYTDGDDMRRIYVFRVAAGVFETDVPGPLLELTAHPLRLDKVEATERSMDRPLVSAGDSAALWKTAREIATSAYADSLYSLFGRPQAPVGLIGRRGRMAGRLGEYIAARDSLALDPARMTGEAQLRHALAHELGHRWQVRSRAQLDMLWWGIKPIRDSKRYGYGDRSEHQAEAIAFAISFLQTTAGAGETPASSLNLLDHYELLVPGTRTIVRYLSLQPIYRDHRLRSLLTGSIQRDADHKAWSKRVY